MYDRSNTTCKVDEANFDLFARKQRAYDAIPPTQASLKKEHAKWAVFQAGHVWGQSTVTEQKLSSPTNWGWSKQDNIWTPKWTNRLLQLNVAKRFRNVVVKSQITQETANDTVQAFHAQHCVHANAKKTDKCLIFSHSTSTFSRYSLHKNHLNQINIYANSV